MVPVVARLVLILLRKIRLAVSHFFALSLVSQYEASPDKVRYSGLRCRVKTTTAICGPGRRRWRGSDGKPPVYVGVE